MTTTIITTNGVGNEVLVLSNLDNTLGPYYRFETGTSMAAADVSGMLALMQDFFTNTLHTLPSPALLKAMLINGARPTGYYDLQVNNAINYDGWGLVNLPNSLPPGIQTTHDGTQPTPIFFQDQGTTNALATGDSQTFNLTVKTNTVELRVTLVWTDPPGNPAAAIKLVNSLELVVTNMDNPTNPVVYSATTFRRATTSACLKAGRTLWLRIQSTTSRTSSYSRRMLALTIPSRSSAAP